MTKILFVFSGTSRSAKDQLESYESEDIQYNEDVVRVYFNGCQDKSIGGQSIFGALCPNLDIAAKNIRECFNENGQLSITSLEKTFGDSIIIVPNHTKGNIEVDSINLAGFSRGAITTFSVARHLDELGKPIHLWAQDPVPGESIDGARKKDSEFNKNYNLSECRNIKRAEVTIGAYEADVNIFHDTYFRQMAPVFSPSCNSNTYVVPKQHHNSSHGNCANREFEFFQEAGCISNFGRYSNSNDPMFFTPKVLAQTHHAQQTMKLKLLPSYRQLLYKNLGLNSELQFNDQTLQALFALHKIDIPTSLKSLLESSITNDVTTKGDMLRDFIIEFENINQHILNKSPKNKVMHSPEINSKAMASFRVSVYNQLIDLPRAATAEDKDNFKKKMLEHIKKLKAELPEKQYKSLKETFKLFLGVMLESGVWEK